MVCTCDACLSGAYNPLDYVVDENDVKALDKARPLGLTGHLRVKNEAGTVEQSVESIIPVLDELIIVYQESQDETEVILQRLAKKYPNKIRLFFYAPHVYPVSTDICHDSSSIHNLANYYNYGYVKTRYKYYMKVDADQVYFTEKLQEIKDTILMEKNILRQWATLVLSSSHSLSTTIYNWLSSLSVLFKMYRKNIILTLGGINFHLFNNQLCMPCLPPPQENRSKYNNVNPYYFASLNGCVGDTLIWVPSSAHRYLWYPTCCEGIYPSGARFTFGLLWCHFHAIKKGTSYNDMGESYYIPALEIAKLSYDEMLSRLSVHGSLYDAHRAHLLFWDRDKKYITRDFIEKYCHPIRDFFIKKYGNM